MLFCLTAPDAMQSRRRRRHRWAWPGDPSLRTLPSVVASDDPAFENYTHMDLKHKDNSSLPPLSLPCATQPCFPPPKAPECVTPPPRTDAMPKKIVPPHEFTRSLSLGAVIDEHSADRHREISPHN
jgi:hypothetical protein